jgi:hypothetical protein
MSAPERLLAARSWRLSLALLNEEFAQLSQIRSALRFFSGDVERSHGWRRCLTRCRFTKARHAAWRQRSRGRLPHCLVASLRQGEGSEGTDCPRLSRGVGWRHGASRPPSRLAPEALPPQDNEEPRRRAASALRRVRPRGSRHRPGADELPELRQPLARTRELALAIQTQNTLDSCFAPPALVVAARLRD